MTKPFSERHGYRPIRSVIQKDDIDDALRTGLWNVLHVCILEEIFRNARYHDTYLYIPNISNFLRRMWVMHFKLPVDTLPKSWSKVDAHFRQYVFSCPWYDLYDFIEYISQNYPDRAAAKVFTDACNIALERELSGYRFVNGALLPVTTEEEIAAIEQALKTPLSSVQIHLQTAIQHLSNKINPDPRNSIKESVSSVEALCSKIAGKKTTLGDALDEISRRGTVKIHPALKDSFIKLYGYSSDSQGIRHALMDEPHLKTDDALFMLVSCSAFVNYLNSKAVDAGITL
jgi:AbiJ-like protein